MCPPDGGTFGRLQRVVAELGRPDEPIGQAMPPSRLEGRTYPQRRR